MITLKFSSFKFSWIFFNFVNLEVSRLGWTTGKSQFIFFPQTIFIQLKFQSDRSTPSYYDFFICQVDTRCSKGLILENSRAFCLSNERFCFHYFVTNTVSNAPWKGTALKSLWFEYFVFTIIILDDVQSIHNFGRVLENPIFTRFFSKHIFGMQIGIK